MTRGRPLPVVLTVSISWTGRADRQILRRVQISRKRSASATTPTRLWRNTGGQVLHFELLDLVQALYAAELRFGVDHASIKHMEQLCHLELVLRRGRALWTFRYAYNSVSTYNAALS